MTIPSLIRAGRVQLVNDFGVECLVRIYGKRRDRPMTEAERRHAEGAVIRHGGTLQLNGTETMTAYIRSATWRRLNKERGE